jgi:hypothetical protein
MGSQAKGFEELVCQIFRQDTQTQGTYHRLEGAGGDGGVEAYVIRADGTKVGLQSKFFDGLGASQWKQIEKSVHAAITNHPELVEYRIAITSVSKPKRCAGMPGTCPLRVYPPNGKRRS